MGFDADQGTGKTGSLTLKGHVIEVFGREHRELPRDHGNSLRCTVSKIRATHTVTKQTATEYHD